ncbi:hypothetical protein SVIOM342S_06926 [Streptomyces violaceorubidus]
MDVQAQHVTGAVQCPSALQAQLQHPLDGALDQAPLDEPLGQHPLGRVVEVAVLGAGFTAAMPASWASYTAS